MNCRKCTKTIPDGSAFCNWCGAAQVMERTPKKRGNGQGTAIRRGNTWTAIWSEPAYIGEDDKLHRKRGTKGGFTSKREALKFAADPHPAAPEAPTLREYWQTYKAGDYLDLSESRKSAARIAWKKLETLASKRMDEITIHDLQRVINDKADTFYPARDMKTVLSHLFKRAVAEGHARTNLADFIRLPKLDETEQEPFAEDELKTLWKAYGEGDHFLGYVLLMIYTGMMPGELQKLEESMIDYDKGEIVGCGLKTTKRKETPIVFPDMLAPVLADLVERSTSRKGRVLGMNKDRFYDEYHGALQRAGVRDLPPYSCRHTTATALALGNIAPSVIQQVMRHTKFATTQRYIHPDTSDARAAINMIAGSGGT